MLSCSSPRGLPLIPSTLGEGYDLHALIHEYVVFYALIYVLIVIHAGGTPFG
jgi:hypothetical protein